MSGAVHWATRDVPTGAVRTAIDAQGFPFPVVIENGMAYDARLYPFESLCQGGIPVSQVRFRDDD